MDNYWKKCGSCKKEIGFQKAYQVCSISSCRKHAYCSVECWDLHNQIMNHKSAWAEEEYSPRRSEASVDQTRRRVVTSSHAKKASPTSSSNVPRDVLIVASKLKAYAKAKHDVNTSANVMDKLSDLVRELTDRACEQARADGRKTLMDRDFK